MAVGQLLVACLAVLRDDAHELAATFIPLECLCKGPASSEQR